MELSYSNVAFKKPNGPRTGARKNSQMPKSVNSQHPKSDPAKPHKEPNVNKTPKLKHTQATRLELLLGCRLVAFFPNARPGARPCNAFLLDGSKFEMTKKNSQFNGFVFLMVENKSDLT